MFEMVIRSTRHYSSQETCAGQALASETDDEALETALRNAQKNGIQLDTLVVTEYHRYEKNTLDDWCALLLRRP